MNMNNLHANIFLFLIGIFDIGKEDNLKSLTLISDKKVVDLDF